MANTNIVVIGAGVVGLTVALQLKRANANFQITIVANHLPGDKSIDYTSPIAGANWHSFAQENEKELQEIDQVGYNEFMRLSQQDPKLAVWQVDNVNYFTGAYEGERVPWFSKTVQEYEDLPQLSLPPGITSGFKFKGVIISVPFYLNYLVALNFDIGNEIKRVSKIEHVEQAKRLHSSGNTDYVINCSGILVNDLQGFVDTSVNFPIRGQVVHVRNNCKDATSVEGLTDFKDELIYIFPRKEGGTVIGGCFQESSTNPDTDPDLTARILERAAKYSPDLLDTNYKNNSPTFDIVSVNVGLRPFRKDGPRIERDVDHPWLIHAYGAGGGGYQGSFGFANKVLQLLQSPSKL